jgi:hypothetical protein
VTRWGRTKSWFETAFGIDVRSLALFRVCLGLIILADIAIRIPDVAALHTDAGILPRALRLATFGGDWGYSVFDVAGANAAITAALLAVYALAACALIAGYRTTLVTFVCWVFAQSLRARNPLVVTGGDTLLVCLLLWSVFLPLGARASVDRALGRGRDIPDRIASFATFAMLFQVGSLFVMTGLAKAADKSWRAGDGVYFALTAEFYTTSVAHWLRELRWLMKPLTYAVLAYEILAPLAMLSPRGNAWIRIAFIASSIAMNFVFWLCLRVGVFSWVTMVAVLVFIPTEVWTGAGGRAARWLAALPGVNGVRDGLARRHRDRAPGPMPPWLRHTRTVALSALMVCMLSGNLSSKKLLGLKPPRWLGKLNTWIGLNQRGWPMFSPTARDHGWFVIAGSLAGGGAVDLFDDGGPIDFDTRPELLSAEYDSYRWRKYYMYIKRGGKRYRERLAQYHCEQWNASHTGPQQLRTVEIVYMQEGTLPDYRTRPAKRVSLLTYSCPE